MAPSHCSVPGCCYSRSRSKLLKESCRALFCIRRPELAKDNAERCHRETLTNFILSMRDVKGGDVINEMLKKESAAICENHFLESDIIVKGVRKQLKIGAKPRKNLQKVSGQFTGCPRKEPAVREDLPQKLRYSCVADLQKAANKLSEKVKEHWIYYAWKSFFILEFKEQDTILPRIRIEFDSNADITAVALSGWKVSNAISLLGNGQLDTLYNVLCKYCKS
ncbi:uncharacterized protein LOC144750005 [Ciona intestinalis]